MALEPGKRPIETELALRLARVGYFLAAGVGVVFAPVGYLTFGSPEFALVSLSFSMAYLFCVFLASIELGMGARVVFSAFGGLHYATVLLLVGPYSGMQSFIACLLATPLLMFARPELRQLSLAYVILIACIVGGEIAAHRYGPLLQLTEDASQVAYLGNVLSSSVFVAYLLYSYSRSSIRNYLKLVAERQKSQQMLYDLMPTPIADRMIRGEPILAESCGEGAVLFADIVGSSNLANHLSPIHLVEVLNGIFTEIDQACEQHGVEKIKTIGDCYMAATGVFPDQNRLEGLIRVGLAIVGIVQRWSDQTGHPLAVRVGVSTGHVVTGVIGRKRPLFDVWGQTVNAASTMESHSETNRVLVTEATHWRVRDAFEFDPPRTISAKSGQLMTAYLLIGPKPQG